jgi:hypothetical protein
MASLRVEHESIQACQDQTNGFFSDGKVWAQTSRVASREMDSRSFALKLRRLFGKKAY